MFVHPLLHQSHDMIVHRIEVWAVGGPQVWASGDLAYKPEVAVEKISKRLTILAKFRQLSTVLVSDSWSYLKQMQLKVTFCIPQGSAATLFGLGGRFYDFLV